MTCEVCGETIEEEEAADGLSHYGTEVGPAEAEHMRGHFDGGDGMKCALSLVRAAYWGRAAK